jgi:hypothetical protein
MRGGLVGFFTGSLALIVLYVALQPGSARAAEAGGGVVVEALRRALSPDVAGVPQRRV